MRPLKPPGVHRGLTRAAARARNLERRFQIVTDLDDYVFLDEQTTVDDQHSFGFADIPALVEASNQGPFRHLVVKLSVAGYTNYGHIGVQWNGNTEDYRTIGNFGIERGTPTGARSSVAPATFQDINGGVQPTLFASMPEGGEGFAEIDLLFPYYLAVNEPSHVRNAHVLFHGCGQTSGDPLTGGYTLYDGTTPSDSYFSDPASGAFWTATGAGFHPTGDPIESLLFDATPTSDFAKDCLASLYGIR